MDAGFWATILGFTVIVLSLLAATQFDNKRQYRDEAEGLEEEVDNLLWLLKEHLGFKFESDEEMTEAIRTFREKQGTDQELQEAMKVLTSNQRTDNVETQEHVATGEEV